MLKYAQDIGIDYPILIGEKEGYAAAEAFGVALVLPFSVFADSQGRIVTAEDRRAARRRGGLHPGPGAGRRRRKRLDLAAARQQIADKMRDFAVERGRKAADEEAHAEDTPADPVSRRSPPIPRESIPIAAN